MTKHLDLENVKIYTKNDVKEAIDLMGLKVYMSDYENFEYYYEKRLTGIQFIEDDSLPFLGYNGDNHKEYFKYFILCKDAKFKEEKEKKYRFYRTIKEFPGGIGSVLTYRSKSEPSVHILTSIQSIATQDNDLVYVYMDGLRYSPLRLLTEYEYLNAKGDKWLPFGVEE